MSALVESNWSRTSLKWLVVLLLSLGQAALPADDLSKGFANPPDLAKPQTWWHWMNGNITKAGITADLEAMKQIGLGGATIVNVDCDIPPGPVKFMSPEWRDDFKFAVQEAGRLGLELCVENCAGWSSSGGPWNTVTNAMQRLTSAETNIQGPVSFDAVLPQPPTTLGYYRDIGVLAFPAPANPANGAPAASAAPGGLQIQRAVYEGIGGGGSAEVTSNLVARIQRGEKSVLVDNDKLGGDPAYGQHKQVRLEFTLDGRPGELTVEEGDELIFPTDVRQLAAARRLEKSSVNRTFVQPPKSSSLNASLVIPPDSIIDLSRQLAADGRLKWEAPAGNWTILRLGYTPIGINNHPAPKEGEGLECDKLSRAALDAHWNGFMQKILDDLGPLAGKALTGSLIDSYEVGNQDWTANFRQEFEKRRGYDPLKFLPTFTHRVVGNPAVTERFLWDMRRTVADLFADDYFGRFAALCRDHGLRSAVEPYSGPFESLQCGAPADVVMGEFWTGTQGHPSVKLAASIAHIYGKPIVGAESFTASAEAGRWQNDPYSLKALGDLMFCQGLNRCVFHRYAMQPWTNRWPGMTMGPWGIHFERTQTWWKPGRAWINYITRCQYLLQQGRAVADAAYFTGEGAPVEMGSRDPALPAGYDFDAVNADVLLHGATVKDGRVTLPGGASYAVLVLPAGHPNLTPEMLGCIAKMVRAGATVVGPRPERSPSLADYPECDAQVKQLAAELWGSCDGRKILENRAGQGRVVWGKSLDQVFKDQNLQPDFEVTNSAGEVDLKYAHRHTDDADIYFVSNQKNHFGSAECVFRVGGKIPELWHPDTGEMTPAPVWSTEEGRTRVRLDFDPAGSVFVVFRDTDSGADHLAGAQADLAPPLPVPQKLEIRRAVYAATDGAGETNVTAKIAGMVSGGQLSVAVNNEVLGTDPATNHVKELRVDYSLDGRPLHAVAGEGGSLNLPASPALGRPPLWEVQLEKDHSLQLKAWSNGQVKLSSANGTLYKTVIADLPPPQRITGPWTLSFPPNWGAPPSITLDHLMSWTDHTNEGVRYFSGTATYAKEMEISADSLQSGRELWLDLGTVKNLAEVSLNGRDLGVLWKPPFRVNLTSAARAGANQLVIKVSNLWPNRLIGDEQKPADCEWDGARLKKWPAWLLAGQPSPAGRFTFATWHYYSKDSPLLPSGLLGPVALRTAAVSLPTPSVAEPYVTPASGLGSWIWDSNTQDGQVCRFWRSFEIPAGAKIAKARLTMTVDNEFTLYLDGRELGHGAEWRELFVFNPAPLLAPGRHVLAVKAMNSFSFAGMLFGLRIDLADGRMIEVKSDPNWKVVPNEAGHWEKMTIAQPSWSAAVVKAPLGGQPWWTQPVNVNVMPVLQPIEVYFWQSGWFQITLLCVCGLVILFSLRLMAQLASHRKERWLLQQERARIAREIHDDIGARMTQLVLHGELAQSEVSEGSETGNQLVHLCEEARGLLSTMDEILWAVNPRRDTLRDFTAYVCNYTQKFLKPTPIQPLFEVDSEMEAAAFDLPLRRNLLMAIKEALNNAVKYSGATELRLQIKWHGQRLTVVVQDNGRGFEPAELRAERNGLANMKQRMHEFGGSCRIVSQPGKGCRVEFNVPLRNRRKSWWTRLWNPLQSAEPVNQTRSSPMNQRAENHDPTKC